MKSIIISTLVLLCNITECRSFSSPRQTPSRPISSSIISSSLMTPIHQLHSSSKPSTKLQSYNGSKYTSRSCMALNLSSSNGEPISSSDNESIPSSDNESISSSSPDDTLTNTSSINTIDKLLSKLTSLFPLFVLASAILGSYIPKTLNWVNNGSYITIMLSA